MKKMKFLFLTLVSSLLLVGCTTGGNKEQTSSDEEQDSSSSSEYYGPKDLFVAFFLDYNTADFDNPYYSYKTEQGKLLTPPPTTPTEEDAHDPAYPIFKGWSSHTVIDNDEDLWDFATDKVGLGERSYLYLYGIWEAKEEEIIPDEYLNYAMYRTDGEWIKKEMSINPDNQVEYMLTNLELEANTEIVFHIDDGEDGDWYHYSDLKTASVGTYEESPAYLHEDGETYSDGNIIAKQAGKYDIYLDTSAAKDDKAAIYMARDTSGDPTTEKVFYLDAGVWDADGAWFAIYAFGSGNEWYTMTKVGNYYQASVNVTKYNQIIFTRMNPAKTISDGWNAKWNQSNDLSVNDGNLYTITGWGEDKSPGSWSNI